jgi:Amt family ammonium transporter
MHDLISFPLPLAAAKSGIDSGDTAWMMVATALVLMMTPALGLFYSGLVRSKNALNTFMMSLGAMAVVSITWVVIGYSLAFGKGDGFIGDLHNVFLKNVTNGPRAGLHIPELVFVCFEGAFCIITAALISGAVVERMPLFGRA